MLSTAVAAPAPVLFVSYSGAYGGAERILVDCAARLGEPAVVACPPGALAMAARDAGLRVAPVRLRTLVLRAGAKAALSHAAGLVGLARDVARIAADERSPAVVAWGMRAVLAAAPPRLGVPVLAVHNDLLPNGPIATAVRAATRRCAGGVALSHAIAEELPPGAAVLHPGVALGGAAGRAAGRAAARTLARRASRMEAARSRARRRRAGSGSGVRPRRLTAPR